MNVQPLSEHAFLRSFISEHSNGIAVSTESRLVLARAAQVTKLSTQFVRAELVVLQRRFGTGGAGEALLCILSATEFTGVTRSGATSTMTVSATNMLEGNKNFRGMLRQMLQQRKPDKSRIIGSPYTDCALDAQLALLTSTTEQMYTLTNDYINFNRSSYIINQSDGLVEIT